MVPNSRASVRADRLRALNVPREIEVVFGAEEPEKREEWETETPVARAAHPPASPAPPYTPIAIVDDGRKKRVESICATWEIDDEWWRDRIARRYVEVILEGGAHVVLYENLLTGRWYLQMI